MRQAIFHLSAVFVNIGFPYKTADTVGVIKRLTSSRANEMIKEPNLPQGILVQRF